MARVVAMPPSPTGPWGRIAEQLHEIATSHFATCPEAAAWRRTRGRLPHPAPMTSSPAPAPTDGMSRVLRASDEVEAS